MTLTIRARLSLWYGVLMLMVLVGAAGAVLWLHGRIGLTRLDGDLEAAARAVAGALQNEFDEGLALEQGALDMVEGMDLPGVGVAVLSAAGRAMASRPAVGPSLAADASAAALPAPTTLAGPGLLYRVRAIDGARNGEAYRIVVWTDLARLDAERVTLRRAMVLGIPLAVLLAVVGGLGLGRRALRSLADVAGQARAINAHRRDARLVAPNPADELGTLARAFNDLLDRLASSLHAQREFMADASHQLRTPVSVVRTAAQVALSRDTRTIAEYREALDVVARQAERLTKMVDDMFMLALVDADARPLQLEPLYVDEVLTEVASEAGLLAASKGLTVRTQIPEEVQIVGDEHLVRQLLMNLFDNAIRHTPPGGTVGATLTRAPGAVRLSVSDTGSGVAAGDVVRIFERFVRIDAAGATGGAGLGLPIARWIAEAHGGSVVLASTGSSGSCFVVTLPLSPQMASPPPVSVPSPHRDRGHQLGPDA